MNDNRLFYLFWVSGGLILCLLAIFMNGTGGGGDSVAHYIYAKYAFQNPENLLNHWGKPFFTLLAFPFTYFSFTGIKLFNVGCNVFSIWLTYQILKSWKINHAWVIAPFMFSSSLFFSVSLSGLTEPLSALMITGAIYLINKNKLKPALLFISFIPFVRSEGLIILGVFSIYLFVIKCYKYIPYLFFGHLVYSIVGYPYYKDLLWIFTKMPYAKQGSNYGNGSWDHFIVQLNFQTNPITYALFWIGTIAMLINIIKQVKKLFLNDESTIRIWLVYGTFFAFFLAHSLFWTLGIFNSMGLVRVFISVLPLMMIISIDGLNLLDKTIGTYNQKIKNVWVYVLLIITISSPFVLIKYKYDFANTCQLTAEQLIIKNQIKPYIEQEAKNKTIIFTDINIPYILNLNPFNAKQSKWYWDIQIPSNLTSNEVLIAENWYSSLEWGYPIDVIKKDTALKLNTCFPNPDCKYFVFTTTNK